MEGSLDLDANGGPPNANEFLSEALDAVEVGVIVIDQQCRIKFANATYRYMFGLSEAECRADSDFASLVRLLAARGEFGSRDVEVVVAERMASIRSGKPYAQIRVRPDGQVFDVCATALAKGGFAFTVTDITAQYRSNEQLEAAHKAMILALADLAEFRDNDTADHVMRVAYLSHQLARELRRNPALEGLIDENFCTHVGVAAIMHDVGKVATPDEILRKPGKLDANEREVMKQHSSVGAGILEKAGSLAPESLYLRLGTEIAAGHHERWDGAGYPAGLAGDDIPLSARIVAVADVYDALTSHRPYKEPWAPQAAIDYIRVQSGSQFDPKVVAAFEHVMRERAMAPSVGWTEQMSVGNDTLDRDHRILLELLNQCWLPSNQSDHTMLDFVLDELVRYTVAHFGREEAHMLRIGYPDYEHHVRVHDAIVAKVKEIRRNLQVRHENIGDDVASFLVNWFCDHILREDKAIHQWWEQQQAEAI